MRMLRTALILDLPRITIINSSSNLIVVIRSTQQMGNCVSRWGASSIINGTFVKAYWLGEKRLPNRAKHGINSFLIMNCVAGRDPRAFRRSKKNSERKSTVCSFLKGCFCCCLHKEIRHAHLNENDCLVTWQRDIVTRTTSATCWSGPTSLFARQLALHTFTTRLVLKCKKDTSAWHQTEYLTYYAFKRSLNVSV